MHHYSSNAVPIIYVMILNHRRFLICLDMKILNMVFDDGDIDKESLELHAYVQQSL